MPQHLLETWAPTEQVICLVELMAVMLFLHNEEQLLHGTDILLFIDNSAALSALIKGRSGCADLDYLAQRIHLRAYSIDARLWVEYVETDANWADGVSREGPNCRWASSHDFRVRYVDVPDIP